MARAQRHGDRQRVKVARASCLRIATLPASPGNRERQGNCLALQNPHAWTPALRKAYRVPRPRPDATWRSSDFPRPELHRIRLREHLLSTVWRHQCDRTRFAISPTLHTRCLKLAHQRPAASTWWSTLEMPQKHQRKLSWTKLTP